MIFVLLVFVLSSTKIHLDLHRQERRTLPPRTPGGNNTAGRGDNNGANEILRNVEGEEEEEKEEEEEEEEEHDL